MINKLMRATATLLTVTAMSLTHAQERQELTVSAAGSLSTAFKAIAAEFEAENPHVKVVLNFAAAGVLVSQIEQGAPVDLFASADQEMMDRAVDKELVVVSTRVNFAQNTLVLVVPKESPNTPKTLADLKGAEYIHIGLGRPGITPAGNHIQKVLQEAQLWEALESKCVFAEHVTQVVRYVTTKEVSAGFVFMTDASRNKNSMRVIFPISKPSDFIYPIAQVKGAKNAELAKAFIAFVLSDKGRVIMAEHGFALP